MRGKRSVSEIPWSSLVLREEGGLAGLRRECRVLRSALDATQCRRIDALVASLPSADAAAADPVADSQQLVLDLDTGAGHSTRVFDRSDLPATVDELRGLLQQIAPLKPVPFG